MTDKEYQDLPRIWGIESYGKVINLNPYRSDLKQDDPTLFFCNEGRDFQVEFKNRSDYKAAENGTIVEVEIIGRGRKRFPAVIRRGLTEHLNKLV